MTNAEAEMIVRELVDRYSEEPLSMPAPDLEWLAEAIEVLGQPRVFQIAEERRRKAECR